MSMVGILIPVSLALLALGVWAFFWAVREGQFEELDVAAWEILIEERPTVASPAAPAAPAAPATAATASPAAHAEAAALAAPAAPVSSGASSSCASSFEPPHAAPSRAG